MVGGDGVDLAALDGIPQSQAALLALHRGRADEVPAILALEDVAGELQIVRAGLHVDLETLVLGLGDGLDAFLIGHMHDVEGSVQALGPGDGPAAGLAGHELGTGSVVIPGAQLALVGELLDEGGEDLVVLGVHADQGAALLGLLQDLVEIAVLDAEIVNHVHLEGGHAVIHGFLHGVQHAQVGDAHMDGEVHGGAVFQSLGLTALDSLQEALALLLSAVVEDHGGAAAGRGAGAGEEVVGGDGSAEGEGQMGVGVDGAGKDELTGSVHDLVRLDVREVGADGGDLLVLDGDVSLEHFLLGYDGSVFDDQIHK